jgi:hypothetical protein
MSSTNPSLNKQCIPTHQISYDKYSDKMATSLWLVVFVNFLQIRSNLAANAAFDKNVDAEPSCGLNKTELFSHISQAVLLPFKRNISTCDQSQPRFAHPPKAVVDENFATFWQTEGGKDKARITIDLSGVNQKV